MSTGNGWLDAVEIEKQCRYTRNPYIFQLRRIWMRENGWYTQKSLGPFPYSIGITKDSVQEFLRTGYSLMSPKAVMEERLNKPSTRASAMLHELSVTTSGVVAHHPCGNVTVSRSPDIAEAIYDMLDAVDPESGILAISSRLYSQIERLSVTIPKNMARTFISNSYAYPDWRMNVFWPYITENDTNLIAETINRISTHKRDSRVQGLGVSIGPKAYRGVEFLKIGSLVHSASCAMDNMGMSGSGFHVGIQRSFFQAPQKPK
jgi:hypothetical protein